MRLIQFVSTVVLMFAVTPSWAQWRLIECSAPNAALPKSYPKQLCTAEDLARRGRYLEAEAAYRKLLDMPIYESPNFEALVDLGRIQCMSNKKAEGSRSLQEFRLALEIFQNARKCSAIRQQNATTVERAAHRRMCSELLAETYETPTTPEAKAYIGDLVERLGATEKICKSVEQ
jgi:hypothetical protein